MNILQQFNITDKLLIVCDESKRNYYNQLTQKYENAQILISSELLTGCFLDEYDSIICSLTEEEYTDDILLKCLKLLKPAGALVLSNIRNANAIKFGLALNGFMKLKTSEEEKNIIATKPKFKKGSSMKLNLRKKAAPAVWKLDAIEDDVETIDPDDLLDEDDLKKPDISSLRVCGTTGKRKACKDCSCGLADELATEARKGEVINTEGIPKSSCGSCYLGDAFRCATCPYLGMPAFKPGEKIQLKNNQLQPDV